VQYSYDDRSVVVVNSRLDAATGLRVRAAVLNVGGTEKWSKSATVDVAPDGVVRAFTVPNITDQSARYFVALTLEDSGGKILSRNFYLLSTVADVLDWRSGTGTSHPPRSTVTSPRSPACRR
jgi:exo-1,4-beta-D-glucosaminidase